MILYIESLSKTRKQYVIHDFDDLEPLFDIFPYSREIALFSENIHEATHNIAEYVSNHHLNAWVEDDGISKNVKSALTGLSMVAAAAMGLSPAEMGKEPISTKVSIKEESKQFKPFGQKPEDAFLHNIMQLETAGGKNLNHPVIKHGKYKGEKAIGRWAVLRPTVHEVLNRMDYINKLHPALKPLRQMSRDQINTVFRQKPHLELEIARFLARHVLARNNNDHVKGAYAWNMGHNIRGHEISDEDLQNHQYTKDFTKLASGIRVRNLSPLKIFRQPAIHKSEKSFQERFQDWLKTREEKQRNNFWGTRTAQNTDIGSNRNPELDRKKPNSLIENLKDAVRLANKKT